MLAGSLAYGHGLLPPDTALRQDLDWLNNRGVINISTTTWPLSQEEVASALDTAKPNTHTDTQVLARIRQQLAQIKSPLEATLYASTQFPGLNTEFGQIEHDKRRASLAGQWQNEYMDLRLQANVVGGDGGDKPSRWLPSGSYAAAKVGNQWLSFGQIDRYWGPGHEGSLILGHSARPVTAFSLQRAEQKPFETPVLSWLGRWQYQIFAGQMSQYNAIPHAKLIGMRFTTMPTDYLELGAHRVIQWGGEGRPQTLKSFGKAMIGKGENEESNDKSNEPGNQIAGLDVRLKLKPLVNLPISVYAQMVGEDEAGYFPSKKAYLMGIDGAHAWGDHTLSWSVEGADTRVEFDKEGIMYGHHLYKDGYYQQGLPLGYALGGDAQSLAARLALTTPDKQTFSGQLLHAKVNPLSQSINGLYPYNTTRNGVGAGWEKTFKNGLNISSNLWYIKSSHPMDNDGVGAALKLKMSFQ